jgi:hypothetical protein
MAGTADNPGTADPRAMLKASLATADPERPN